LPPSETVRSASMREMSMTARGRTMRRLSIGPSVMPPANTAASSRSSASNPTVSATVAGR
jgi:hypothetical protein